MTNVTKAANVKDIFTNNKQDVRRQIKIIQTKASKWKQQSLQTYIISRGKTKRVCERYFTLNK